MVPTHRLARERLELEASSVAVPPPLSRPAPAWARRSDVVVLEFFAGAAGFAAVCRCLGLCAGPPFELQLGVEFGLSSEKGEAHLEKDIGSQDKTWSPGTSV